jgi:hypothetical protein
MAPPEVVNTRSRSRPNQAVPDGTPEPARNEAELRKSAGQSRAAAFLDTEEVRGSDPLAPISERARERLPRLPPYSVDVTLNPPGAVQVPSETRPNGLPFHWR